MALTSQEIKIFKDGFQAINANLVGLGKEIRSLRKVVGGREKKDDYWHWMIGEEAVDPPGEEYDWVLVKVRDSWKVHPLSIREIYDLPHIAEFRSDKKWWPLEWDGPYETENVPFEVVAWRPIPGDTVDIFYAHGIEVSRRHRYE